MKKLIVEHWPFLAGLSCMGFSLWHWHNYTPVPALVGVFVMFDTALFIAGLGFIAGWLDRLRINVIMRGRR